MGSAKCKNAFTLIELLVVIAIIALLLAILMPSLKKVKRQAQGVVCKAHVRQWALSYQLYAEQNDDKLALTAWGGNVNNSYTEVLRPFYDDIDKIRYCPVAAKMPTSPNWGSDRIRGDTFEAWWLNPTAFGWMNDDDLGLGSYGENYRIRSPEGSDDPAMYWGTITSKGAYDIPMFTDAKWHNFAPDNGQNPPTGPGFYDLGQWDWIYCALMRRHGDGINVAFMDMSARHVRAEHLWTLKWHPQYQKRWDIPELTWMPKN